MRFAEKQGTDSTHTTSSGEEQKGHGGIKKMDFVYVPGVISSMLRFLLIKLLLYFTNGQSKKEEKVGMKASKKDSKSSRNIP